MANAFGPLKVSLKTLSSPRKRFWRPSPMRKSLIRNGFFKNQKKLSAKPPPRAWPYWQNLSGRFNAGRFLSSQNLRQRVLNFIARKPTKAAKTPNAPKAKFLTRPKTPKRKPPRLSAKGVLGIRFYLAKPRIP